MEPNSFTKPNIGQESLFNTLSSTLADETVPGCAPNTTKCVENEHIARNSCNVNGVPTDKSTYISALTPAPNRLTMKTCTVEKDCLFKPEPEVGTGYNFRKRTRGRTRNTSCKNGLRSRSLSLKAAGRRVRFVVGKDHKAVTQSTFFSSARLLD